jgi:tetratricopeptide (TPR) repeat protein
VPLSLVIAVQAERDKLEIARQENIALANEAETKAVLEFVENRVFAAARPEGQEGGLGHAVTLRQAVESALPYVAKSFTGKPLIEARLRKTLGRSFGCLGDWRLAAEQHEAARALYAQHLGPDHPDTLLSINEVAYCYYSLGRHTEALKLREEILPLQQAKLGPDHPHTLFTMMHVADSYEALGWHADALKLREENLRLWEAKLGPDHDGTVGSMNNLANSYKALGRYADALKLHEQTLALRKDKLGRDHPDTLVSMHNLAISYAALGRHADALKLHEETLALRKVKLGPDHPHTLGSMWGVAECLVKLGRGAEAVPIIDDCVARAAVKVVNPRLLPGVMDLRLRHFEKTKDPAGCRQTAEMWEKLNRADATSLYTATRMRAVTAATAGGKQADAEAEQAMAWLRKAVAAGYKDAAHMEKDKDLDALRNREDFKKLLAELAADSAKQK